MTRALCAGGSDSSSVLRSGFLGLSIDRSLEAVGVEVILYPDWALAVCSSGTNPMDVTLSEDRDDGDQLIEFQDESELTPAERQRTTQDVLNKYKKLGKEPPKYLLDIGSLIGGASRSSVSRGPF